MKISEMIKTMQKSLDNNGDMNIEVWQYSKDDKKRYWCSSGFEGPDSFVIGFNIDSLSKNRK